MSLMRRGGTLISLASWYWLRDSGARNSSDRISPGCTGSMITSAAMCSSLVVVNDLDVLRPCIRPAEADTPLLIDADAVLPGPVPGELLQAVAGRNPHAVSPVRGVEHRQLTPGNTSHRS